MLCLRTFAVVPLAYNGAPYGHRSHRLHAPSPGLVTVGGMGSNSGTPFDDDDDHCCCGSLLMMSPDEEVLDEYEEGV